MVRGHYPECFMSEDAARRLKEMDTISLVVGEHNINLADKLDAKGVVITSSILGDHRKCQNGTTEPWRLRIHVKHDHTRDNAPHDA